MIYLIGIIILVLAVIIVYFIFKFLKLKDMKTSIEMCSEKIDEILKSKHDLVDNILKKIKNEKIEKSFTYDENASLYEREDSLFNVAFEINKYVKESKNKKASKELSELASLEENLDGLKDFYNTNVLNYNEIYMKKIFNKIFKLLKFENYKSFKMRKLQEYEIFKN